MKKNAVIFTGLVNIDKNLVGTAVIYKKIADLLLAEGYKVIMVVPEATNINLDKISFSIYNTQKNEKLINSASLVIFGSYPPTEPLIYAYNKKKTIFTYLWSIAPIGSLEFKDFRSQKKQMKLHRFITASYNLSLLLSDKIFCRDEQIKRFIWGSLTSLGRVNLENYYIDRQFNSLVEAAPFGIDFKKPKHKKDIYRKKISGIKNDDFILLWNGGVWNWNDGESLVRAMKKIKNKKVKLIFQGFKHPGKDQVISEKGKACFELSKKLKLKDKNIFFHDEWIPYIDRGNYLTECNAGVISSPNIPEANLFFKTRIYDYFWSELPIILNDCEAFAGVIKNKGLGLVIKTGNILDLANKIDMLSGDKNLQEKFKANIRAYKKEIGWNKSLKPIEKYIKDPLKIKDKYKKNKLIQDNIKLNKDIVH